MRILFIAHRIPYPPNKGDKIRSYNILQHLARSHDVWLATLVDSAEDLPGLDVLREGVCGLVHSRIDQPARRLLALREVVGGGAITVRYFYSPQLQSDIDDLLDTVEFDAVVCSSSPMAEYVFRSRHVDGRLAQIRKIMDLIDVDSYKWRQYAERRPPWSAWLYRRESATLARYEVGICEAFDHVLLVSEQEKTYFPTTPDRVKLEAVANGVDLEFFRPAGRAESRQPTLVFTGMMDYWPNVEGMRWFIAEVYPLIRAALPAVRLLVVGGRPTREVRGWHGQDGIEVTGFVPDIREYLGRADLCIAPLRVARGIQNKVLEAMAMARPVVSTPQAFEGIRAAAGDDLVVAREPRQFAATVVALMNDAAERLRIGTNARRCVERHYSWGANLAVLDALLAPGAAATAGLRG